MTSRNDPSAERPVPVTNMGSDSPSCPECGASSASGLTCEELFWQLLAREQDDPELLAEHYLTVACYNLQHPAQFTDDALENLRAGLVERLDHGVAVAELRRRASRAFKGPTRVLRRESERRPVLEPWPMTIADVWLPERSEGVADRVRRWAAAIRGRL